MYKFFCEISHKPMILQGQTSFNNDSIPLKFISTTTSSTVTTAPDPNTTLIKEAGGRGVLMFSGRKGRLRRIGRGDSERHYILGFSYT